MSFTWFGQHWGDLGQNDDEEWYLPVDHHFRLFNSPRQILNRKRRKQIDSEGQGYVDFQEMLEPRLSTSTSLSSEQKDLSECIGNDNDDEPPATTTCVLKLYDLIPWGMPHVAKWLTTAKVLFLQLHVCFPCMWRQLGSRLIMLGGSALYHQFLTSERLVQPQEIQLVLDIFPDVFLDGVYILFWPHGHSVIKFHPGFTPRSMTIDCVRGPFFLIQSGIVLRNDFLYIQRMAHKKSVCIC